MNNPINYYVGFFYLLEMYYLCGMEILEYLLVSLVMGVISYVIWNKK